MILSFKYLLIPCALLAFNFVGEPLKEFNLSSKSSRLCFSLSANFLLQYAITLNLWLLIVLPDFKSRYWRSHLNSLILYEPGMIHL
jgi:hypothetical protein